MRYLFLMIICSLFWQSDISANETMKEKVRNRQMRRKLSFEEHFRDKAERDRVRRKKAFKHKMERLEQEIEKEKARLSFRRRKRSFPVAAWRSFLREREEKIAKHKILRKEYVRVQKELDRIKQMKKYRIDKNREYQL